MIKRYNENMFNEYQDTHLLEIWMIPSSDPECPKDLTFQELGLLSYS